MKNLFSLGLKVVDDALLILDQTRLPQEECWLGCRNPQEMIAAIKGLKVRGAPLIGVAAAISLALYAAEGVSRAELLAAAKALRAARPTAVNLMAAMDRMIGEAGGQDLNAGRLIELAEEIFEEDVLLCEKMADNAAGLIENGDGVLTHCNSGGLATAGIGTALGVIRRAHEKGLEIRVFADETRPLLQGARLTAWELERLKIPYTLICDNMAADLMRRGRIQKVFVGADRIAANGDFANKVGTYGLAVAARYHGLPFYPVAPHTTLDRNCPSGKEIPVEERAPAEVRGAAGSFGEVRWSPADSNVFNPAFDVTPVELVTGLVMDSGYYSQAELLKW